MIRVLGIDPGSRHTGYGVVAADGQRLIAVAHGCIQPPPDRSFAHRLAHIHEKVAAVIDETAPDEMAVEDVFLARNVKSALRLGEARGAAILAGVRMGLSVHQYSALQIKQAVVGYGRAGKDQVTQMIRTLLALRTSLNTHAADALAVAVCHINTRASERRWKALESR